MYKIIMYITNVGNENIKFTYNSIQQITFDDMNLFVVVLIITGFSSWVLR